MQIVIKISDEDYELVQQGHIPFSVLDVIKNGTPLPKGHGDLISRQRVIDKLKRLIKVEELQGTDEMNYGRERVSAYECMISEVESEFLYPTIIEADKEE